MSQEKPGPEPTEVSRILQNSLESILAVYAQARRQEPFGRDHPLWGIFRSLEEALTRSRPVSSRPTLRLTWSVGHGAWAKIPWLAIHDTRETSTPDDGLHLRLLFRQDMSGVYLALTQGTLRPRHLLGPADGLRFLHSRLEPLRARFRPLERKDFRLDGSPELRSDSNRAGEQEHVAVAWKLYERGAVPLDKGLVADLETLLSAYSAYLEERRGPARRPRLSWILRRPAREVDLAGLVRQARETTWPVAGAGSELAVGDRVFLWEESEDAGILGIATVIADPDEVEASPEERKATLRAGASGSSLRVRLRLDRVLPERVRPVAFRDSPTLAGLPLKPGQGDPCVRLDPEQGRALSALVSGIEGAPFDLGPAMAGLVEGVAARGFVFEPWQVAAYVTALRTKPFVILAGVSGTGKSRLPALVAEATGGEAHLLSVRPDWTDSADVLGYPDLQGRFRPGLLLELARAARAEPTRSFVCIVDEMNLARVEHYFAEVLSRIEDRRPAKRGGYESSPLVSQQLSEADKAWRDVGLPPNLAIVGTVNMDESAHGFSRKVLDRAFTIEFSDVDLATWEAATLGDPVPAVWPVKAWFPRAIRLGSLEDLGERERALVDRVVEALTQANRHLAPAQLQLGYRSRDEIALFLLHAEEMAQWFVTRDGERVDPLDLALQMKILPRIVGGSSPVRRAVLELLGWAHSGEPFAEEEDAEGLMADWDAQGRPGALKGARHPRTAARLALMWDRLLNEGFTSFWL